jgi:UDP-N-acetylmuramoyl-L-alanyl-D-glutamate--2,6-diaminopimelate ligase
MLAKAVEKGCEYAFMEVSSHGIHQDRIEGLHFAIAGFTNLTHDHLDYHKTFDEYLKTKKDSLMNCQKLPLQLPI